MSPVQDFPPLPVELPDELAWLEPDVRVLQRTQAWSISAGKPEVLSPGSTRRTYADLPADAAWAEGRSAESFACHHEDGPSLVLQLNLSDIPVAVRRPEWPLVGVLWVFLESNRRNVVTVEFDPRAAEDIPWRAAAARPERRINWSQGVSLPWRTETILPVLWNWAGVGDQYDDWVQRHYREHPRESVQLGGWGFTNQGDVDEDSREIVVTISDLYFGDCGEVYVFFNPQRGFYGRADIC